MIPFISICIPAYKRVDYLSRLLNSIDMQVYKDFEVIITDDSNDKSVEKLSMDYMDKFPIFYSRNKTPLGTPGNWNEAIKQAKGTWIKLMHDDDWFSSLDSLAVFANVIKQYPNNSFFYSAYQNVYEESGKTQIIRINNFRKRKLEKDPVTLFSSNVIGPPSVTLVRNNKQYWYEPKMRWVVDIDFYIRCLANEKPVYIKQPLVNVGINSEQVTHTASRVPSVEIPENFYLLKKTGIHHLKNILIYDAWWRLIRNLRILRVEDVRQNGYSGDVHFVLIKMINWQRKIPAVILNVGIFSKILMLIHFWLFQKKIVE